MNQAILRHLHRVPRDIDLIVGVPGSGLVAAALTSLATQVPIQTLENVMSGAAIPAAGRRPRVLVIDDSIETGRTMADLRERISTGSGSADFVFAAVFGPEQRAEVDLVFEILAQPSLFQWNFMRQKHLAECCVDIDGVLCRDPLAAETASESAYRDFLRDAIPLYRPTARIGELVTRRHERFRAQTEEWMKAQGIVYDRLVMFDPRGREGRALEAAVYRYKGDHYRDSHATLFIESSDSQSHHIAEISGKPVLSIESQRIIRHGEVLASGASPSAKSRLVAAAKSVLGPKNYAALRERVKN